MNSNRTIIVGDVHGHYEEACRLLDKCKVACGDRVVFVGDLVDRGPRSDACLDLAISLERDQQSYASVLGNHEECHIAYNNTELLGQVPNVVSETHRVTRSQLRSEHYRYMRSMPLWISLPEHNVVVVHAGLYPDRYIAAQSTQHFLHAVNIAPLNEHNQPSHEERTIWPSQMPPSSAHNLRWAHWSHFWKGPERAVFGHLYTDAPIVTQYAVGLDGGCCFGGELRALVLPNDIIVSVPSTVSAKNNEIRRSTGLAINKFEVHPGVYAYC